MDIIRKDLARKRRIRQAVWLVLSLVCLAAITYGLSRLEPAAPQVESGVFIDKVTRGPMPRLVRGLGTLVPEQILLIPARDEGRVERRNLLPGVFVEPSTVLVELSNPQLEQETFDAVSALRAAEADLANLKVKLETDRLNQEALAADIESQYQQAQAQYEADRQLFEAGLTDQITLTKSKVAAEQLAIRARLEKERLEIQKEAAQAQLAAQQARNEQARGLVELRQAKLERLKVRAGIRGVLQQVEAEVGQLVTPGTVLARVSDPQRLKAALKIPETQAKDILLGQKAEIDTRNGIIPGTVMRIDPGVTEGTVVVDVQLDGELPRGARPDLSVDGTIELERIDDAVQVGRPVYAQPDQTISLFKIEPDGIHAVRAAVKIGKVSVNRIQIEEGLQVGDEVILSDMSAWDEYDRVRVK
jgi:multidrug efflux pump subunit AcrA (membrane-fusion protein)